MILRVLAPALMYKGIWYGKRLSQRAKNFDDRVKHLDHLNNVQQLLLFLPLLLIQGKHFEDGQSSSRGHKDACVWCSFWSRQVVSGCPVFCQNHYTAHRCGQTRSCQYWLWWPWDTGELFFSHLSACPIFTVPFNRNMEEWAVNGNNLSEFGSFPGWVVINWCLSACPFL